MALWHLEELRTSLEKRGWRFVAELPGDDRSISASWKFVRSSPDDVLIIDFNGLDDMETLPIEAAYGCSVRDRNGLGLYFGRKGVANSEQRRRWQTELKDLVAKLS